jgi:hypothetical protein
VLLTLPSLKSFASWSKQAAPSTVIQKRTRGCTPYQRTGLVLSQQRR